MKIIFKILIVPIFTIGVSVAYGLVTYFARNYLIYYSYPRTFKQMILESIIGAFTAAAIFSFPISKIYQTKAIIISFIACGLVLYLRIPDIFNFWQKDNDIVIMGALEPAILLSALTLGCVLANYLLNKYT